jgi:hypothetical protein
MTGMFGFGRAGFDYFINNRNTITVSGSMARGRCRHAIPMSGLLIHLENGIAYPYEFNDIVSNAQRTFRNYGTQVSFKHLFPKAGREWTADVTLNRGSNTNNNLIQTDFYDCLQKRLTVRITKYKAEAVITRTLFFKRTMPTRSMTNPSSKSAPGLLSAR